MLTLVLNAGSSSLRFALFDEKLALLYKGHIDGIGQPTCHFRHYLEKGEEQEKCKIKDHKEAIEYAKKKLNGYQIKKVAHRVVHGGEKFTEALELSFLKIRELEKLSSLAPLHNPANIAAIKAARKILPKAKHFAIFDTAFHSSLPEHAYLYGLPYKLYKKEGIRRYGFHGTSHKFVSDEAAKLLRKKSAKIISCHIGNGVSVSAIKNGKSVDTSMGFTPLEGPMMGTRSGTIDPAIIFHLAKKRKLDDIKQMLEKESGFKGMSEIGSDIRMLWAKPNSAGTKRTFALFSYQMAKIILGMFAPLGKPDAIVFTAGIGENAYYLRGQICEYLKEFGVQLDEKANKKCETIISKKTSKIKVFVIKTEEELEMAKQIRN